MRIKDDDFDTSMLTLQDFNIEPLKESVNGAALYHDAKQNRRLALMCIELAKLCVCIGHVLSSQYTALTTDHNSAYSMMVVPRQDSEQARELERCDIEIKTWFQSLHPDVDLSRSRLEEDDSSHAADVHWAILRMIHLTSVSVLHRPRVLQQSSNSELNLELRKESRAKIKEAARNLTKIVSTMLRRDQVRFLSGSGITALISAGLAHILDTRSADEDVRDAGLYRFNQCMQALQVLRTIYASADSAASFLLSAIGDVGASNGSQISNQVPVLTSDLPKDNAQLSLVGCNRTRLDKIASTHRSNESGSAVGRSGVVPANLEGNATIAYLHGTAKTPQRWSNSQHAHSVPGSENSLQRPSPTAMEYMATPPTVQQDHLSMNRNDFDDTNALPEDNFHFNHALGVMLDQPPDFLTNPLFGLNRGLDFAIDNDPVGFDYSFYKDNSSTW